MLAKFNCIETLISKALNDMNISHEEFVTVQKEKDKYEKMKENVGNISGELKEKKENKKLKISN